MKKFAFCCVLFAALSLCVGTYHHRPPLQGFRPIPVPGYRPSYGPPSRWPSYGPPPRGSSRPGYGPPRDNYRPYWPKNPNNDYSGYQSPGMNDNSYQSLGLGDLGVGEVEVSSYFPVSSYPPPSNDYSYHQGHRPSYKPSFTASDQDIFSQPPYNMIPPIFSGQAPDYSAPIYSNQQPANLAPIFPNQFPDFSAPTISNQVPANLAPIFPNLQSDFSAATVSNQPSDSFSPVFQQQPPANVPSPTRASEHSSPIDYWLPASSIPSSPSLTTTTTTTTTSKPPARTFPPTVAPVYNNSLPVNNVSVVIADDDVFDRVFLDNDNCSSVFPLTESDELLLSFKFSASLAGRCVLTFTGPAGGLKVALQISNVTLMRDNGTKVDCEKQSLGIFSHKAGNLFKMEQLCGLETNSAVLLTDSQSPLITLTFVNQPPVKNNTAPFSVSFNMQLFTYALNTTSSWP